MFEQLLVLLNKERAEEHNSGRESNASHSYHVSVSSALTIPWPITADESEAVFSPGRGNGSGLLGAQSEGAFYWCFQIDRGAPSRTEELAEDSYQWLQYCRGWYFIILGSPSKPYYH
ncbi:hypothetical protein [Halobacterium wangiae]|uniref:hypothetical protein n=1 Tax=Halobacterium wangiae TaxID=2902623 RepID=UPI001E288CF7|nr:hypothetical protein [Halobacterium wangiae]